MAFKVIIDYGKRTDTEIDVIAKRIFSNCTGNKNLTFVNGELTDIDTAEKDYATKLVKAASRATLDISAKNAAKKVLAGKMKTACIQINVQGKGDETILKSSGAVMAKQKGYVDLYAPTSLKVDNAGINSGEMHVSTETSPAKHGVNFYCMPTPASKNMEDWRMEHSNGHEITFHNLKVGTEYAFTAAFKGRDLQELVYADYITKVVS